MKVPQEFEEAARFLCPFCAKEIRSGSLNGQPAIYHDQPQCNQAAQCDDVYQFMLIVTLKNKLDAGQVEIN